MHSTASSTAWAGVAAAAAALSPVAHAGAPTRQPHSGQHPEPLVVKVDDRRFRWGDAGIGAAAGFGGALVVVGGVSLSRAGWSGPTGAAGHEESTTSSGCNARTQGGRL